MSMANIWTLAPWGHHLPSSITVKLTILCPPSYLTSGIVRFLVADAKFAFFNLVISKFVGATSCLCHSLQVTWHLSIFRRVTVKKNVPGPSSKPHHVRGLLVAPRTTRKHPWSISSNKRRFILCRIRHVRPVYFFNVFRSIINVSIPLQSTSLSFPSTIRTMQWPFQLCFLN